MCDKIKYFLIFSFLLFSRVIYCNGNLVGNVTNEKSQPISSVSIEASSKGNTYNAATDKNGNYFIPNMVDDTYTVTASFPGYQSQTKTVTISNGSTQTVNFQLNPELGLLTVNTFNSITLDPLKNVAVSVVGQNTYAGSSGSNASISFQSITPGQYVLSGTLTNYTPDSKQITISAGIQTDSLYLTPNNTGVLSGNVSDSSGAILPGVTIDLIFENQVIETQSTDSQGNYQFSGIAPGSYIIHAYNQSYQNSVIGVVLYDDQNTTTNFILNSNPLTLSGVVSDSSSNVIENATISIFSSNLLLFTTLSDINGAYSIVGLSPGNYTIVASNDNYQSNSINKTISTNSATQDIVIIANTGSLQGIVTDSLSIPIQGAVVVINSNNSPLYSYQCGGDGIYKAKNIPEGTYDIHVHKNGYTVVIDSVTISSLNQIKNFTLSPATNTVGGYVGDTNGTTTVAGAYLNLYYNGIFIQTALTDSTGYYEFQGFPSGNYQILTSLTGFFTTESFFSLNSNQSLQLNIGLSTSAAPINGSAVLSLNRYAMQTQKVYSLSWQTIPGIAVAGFNIYRNSLFIKHINRGDILNYVDKTPPNTNVVVYTIVSFDKNNQPIGALNVYP